MTSVAVAVNGGDGNGSRRAVKWAVKNLMPTADRFVLVHVMPRITSIPTPSGDRIPVAELDDGVVATYVKDMKDKYEEAFTPFKKLCKSNKVETLVLEDEAPANGILSFISQSDINCLVLGSSSSNYITRKLKGPDVPTVVMKCAPESCDIHVVSKQRVITKSASPSSVCESSTANGMCNGGEDRGGSGEVNERITGSRSSYRESTVYEAYGAPSMSDLSYLSSEAFTRMEFPANASVDQERSHQNLEENLEFNSFYRGSSPISSNIERIEVEQLRAELQNTLGMYKRACEELVHAQSKVQLLSSECLEEARRVDAALENEETLRKIAAEEAAKHLKARKEIEEAKVQLTKEAYERQVAELNALKESTGKKEFVDALFSSDSRYRRYTRKEIEIATNFFSETNVIGEGGYGKVYKCSLDQTPVAVKVLRADAVEKKEEFLKEVEILSQLHHPNIVLLLGACPEIGCLVYEYLENGSLEDYISHRRNGKPSLPWTIRFRIIFEVACGGKRRKCVIETMYYCLSTLPHFATIRPKPTSLSPHRALPIRAMRAVVQRVASASVEVEGRTVSAIGPGLLVLVGLHESDTVSDAEYICRKVLNMRLFTNESSGRGWDQNVMQRNYEVLLVSQFTLYGTLKGNKPDFHVAMAPDKAKPFYASLVESFRKSYKPDAIKDGVFGAMMKVNLVNDGPVTMQFDSPSPKNSNGVIEES